MNKQQRSNPVGKRSRTFYLDMELDDRLIAKAKRNGESVSSVIRAVLQAHLDNGGAKCQ